MGVEMEINFVFGFGEAVKILRSQEAGKITGVCRHARTNEQQFFVEYVAKDGKASEAWFYESELEAQLKRA